MSPIESFDCIIQEGLITVITLTVSECIVFNALFLTIETLAQGHFFKYLKGIKFRGY